MGAARMLNPTVPYFYLMLYLVVLYVRPHEYVPALMNLPLQPVLLVGAFLFWLARQDKQFKVSQFWLLPVLTVLMALSVAFTGWFGGAQKVLSDFIPVVMLFYMVATSTDSLLRLRQVFFVLGCCIVVIAVHGIDQIDKGVGWTGAELSQGTRITYLGFLNDPNDLSMALVMVLPMLMHLAHGAGFIKRWVWRAAAGAVVYAVYLTNSRGSVLALAAMLGLYGVLRYGVVKSVIVLPSLLLPILLFGPSRMGDMSASEDSAEGRVHAWYEGVQLLLMRPLFGVGKGQFVEHHGLTAHNSYVLAFAELGLVGYYFWLANIVLCWLMLSAIVRGPEQTASAPADPQAPPPPPWAEVRRSALTLWYGYLGGLVSAFFLSRSYVVILYLHVALIVAVHQLARRHYPGLAPVTLGQRPGRMLGMALGTVFGMWILTRVLLAFGG